MLCIIRFLHVCATLTAISSALSTPRILDGSKTIHQKRANDESDLVRRAPTRPSRTPFPPELSNDNSKIDYIRTGGARDTYQSKSIALGAWGDIETGWILQFRKDLLQGCSGLLDNSQTYVLREFRRVEEPFEYALPDNRKYRMVQVQVHIPVGTRIGSIISTLQRRIVQTPPVSRKTTVDRFNDVMKNAPYRGEPHYAIDAKDLDPLYAISKDFNQPPAAPRFAFRIAAVRRQQLELDQILDYDDVRPTWQTLEREYGCLLGLRHGRRVQGLDVDGVGNGGLSLGLLNETGTDDAVGSSQ